MSDMKFTMGSAGIPVGSYQAEFIGGEPYRENVEKYGEGVLLKWRVVDGIHNGEETSRITSRKLSPKSALGKLAVAMKGEPIARGEDFDVNEYVGTRGCVLVEETDGHGLEPFIRWELGNLAALQGDAAAREHELREAHRLFTDMGAPIRAQQVQALLGGGG